MRRGVVLAAIVGAFLVTGLGVFAMREPRGIRNKNPLNIRVGDNWQGMAEAQTDGAFVVFKDERFGYRAAARIVDNYRKRGVKTLAQIVATWAPTNENDTGAYIASVAGKTGIDANSVIGRDDYPALFAAMTVHENGKNPYPIETIVEGISWA